MSEIINIFKIEYETSDKSLKFEIHINQGYPLKYNCYGKTWAKRTEAIIYQNNFLLTSNYNTKHYNDKDDLKYAVVNTLKPIIGKINVKFIRSKIWALIFKQIELCQKEK